MKSWSMTWPTICLFPQQMSVLFGSRSILCQTFSLSTAMVQDTLKCQNRKLWHCVNTCIPLEQICASTEVLTHIWWILEQGLQRFSYGWQVKTTLGHEIYSEHNLHFLYLLITWHQKFLVSNPYNNGYIIAKSLFTDTLNHV